MIYLEDKAPQNGQYTVTVGTTFTPVTLTWRLMDEDETVINSRTTVSVAVPSTSNTIKVSGADLALPDSKKARRYLLTKGTDASGAPFADACSFDIEDLPGST